MIQLPRDPTPDPATDARAHLLERLASGRLELPIMPAAAAEVLVACRDEKAGVERIVQLVTRDPALTAHVLRVANSATYAASQPVTSPQAAISRVGLTTVTQIALAACVRDNVFQADRYRHLLAPVWPHSVMTAGWAREIATMKDHDVDGAFLAGLLHDVGRPIVIQALGRIENETRHTFGDDQALTAMDYLHPRVGGELMRHWKMPDWIVDAITWHHNPDEAPGHRAEAFTTAFAAILSDWILAGDATAPPDVRHQGYSEALGIGPEGLERLLARRGAVIAMAQDLA
jgi:putative nucleotidyltransferase with HDIG domain